MSSPRPDSSDGLSLWSWLKLAVIALALIGLAVFGLAIVAGLGVIGVVAFFLHRLFRKRRRPEATVIFTSAADPFRSGATRASDGDAKRGPVIDVDYTVAPDPKVPPTSDPKS